MATLKMVLADSELSINGQDASGCVKYYCDGVSGSQMEILNNAANSVPYGIGDKFPVVAQGGPSVRIGFRSNQIPIGVAPGIRRTQHQLRVMTKRPYLTNNATKVWVELGLRSPPTASESSGAALIQKRNEFYLKGPNDNPKREQILLTYFIQKGQFGANNPPSILRLPQASATCSKYFYGETFRASNTFFYDEITPTRLQNLKQLYTGRLNGNAFLYQDAPVGGSSGDARQWLCTGVDAHTPDNGMTYTISAEWTYNIEYWDPIIIQTDAHGQPVKIDPQYITRIQQSLASGANGRQFNNGSNGNIPSPGTETGAGAGRFPIYQAADMWKLLRFIRKELSANELL